MLCKKLKVHLPITRDFENFPVSKIQANNI